MNELMTLPYNTPVQVTDKQYNLLMSRFAGVVAGRIEGGKYFIMLWLVAWRKEVIKMIKASA